MTTPIFTVVTLTARSGIPEDAVQNSWCFIHPSDNLGPDEFIQIEGLIRNFYDKTYAPNAYPVSAQLSPSIVRVGEGWNTFTHYDISPREGGGMGPPVHESQFSLSVNPAGSIPMVNEVAVCLSLTANAAGIPEHAPGGARPKARYRGRLFLGPLTTTVAAVQGATSRVVVDTGFQDKLLAAAAGILNDQVPLNIHWSVWSRTDKTARAVTGGFIDDAFDTQRSRGQAPEARRNFGNAPGFLDNLPLARPTTVMGPRPKLSSV